VVGYLKKLLAPVHVKSGVPGGSFTSSAAKAFYDQMPLSANEPPPYDSHFFNFAPAAPVHGKPVPSAPFPQGVATSTQASAPPASFPLASAPPAPFELLPAPRGMANGQPAPFNVEYILGLGLENGGLPEAHVKLDTRLAASQLQAGLEKFHHQISSRSPNYSGALDDLRNAFRLNPRSVAIAVNLNLVLQHEAQRLSTTGKAKDAQKVQQEARVVLFTGMHAFFNYMQDKNDPQMTLKLFNEAGKVLYHDAIRAHGSHETERSISLFKNAASLYQVAVSFAPEEPSRAKVLALLNMGNTCLQIANQPGHVPERLAYHHEGLAYLNDSLKVATQMKTTGKTEQDRRFGTRQIASVRGNIAKACNTSLTEAVDFETLQRSIAQLEKLLSNPQQLHSPYALTVLKAELLNKRAGLEIEQGGTPAKSPVNKTLTQSLTDTSQALAKLLNEPTLDINMVTAIIKTTRETIRLATITTPAKKATKADKVELQNYAGKTVMIIIQQLAKAGLFNVSHESDFGRELEALKEDLSTLGYAKDISKITKKASKASNIIA